MIRFNAEVVVKTYSIEPRDDLKELHIIDERCYDILELKSFKDWCDLTRNSKINSSEIEKVYEKMIEYGWIG